VRPLRSLAILIIGYEAFTGAEAIAGQPFIIGVAFTLYVLRWMGYAFAFGYFYPAIGGETPTAKAARLLPVVAVSEVAALVSRSAPDVETAILAACLCGQAIVFAFGLALVWEWRLSHRGGVAWGSVRDFRTLRALAVPVSTVLVAVLTTAVTIVAGAR
jgi:hypothetical protein